MKTIEYIALTVIVGGLVIWGAQALGHALTQSIANSTNLIEASSHQ